MTEEQCKKLLRKSLDGDLVIKDQVDRLFDSNDRNGMIFLLEGILNKAQRDNYPGMPKPPKEFLPFFTYGAFKKGELAFRRLEKYLDPDRPPEEASIDGELYLRDGLPLYQPSASGMVGGWILFFKTGYHEGAYKEIRTFEPADIYEWDQTEIEGEIVNLLIGKNLDKGNPVPFEGSEWSYREDPAFKFGLKCIGKALEKFGKREFRNDPDNVNDPYNVFEWGRFFKLQMAYLLLWSIIERYASLAYGPRLNDRDRIIGRLGDDVRFVKFFRESVMRNDKVSKTLNPMIEAELDPDEPKKSIEYYYQIRCNLSHRGKGAWMEAEKVRQSLQEMYNVMCKMLSQNSQ